MDSPIQIIAIQSPTGARLLRPSMRDARTNRNNNNIDTNSTTTGTIRIIGNKGKNIGTEWNGRGGKFGGYRNNVNNNNDNGRAGRGSKIIVIQPERNRRPQMMVNNHRSMRLHVAPGAYPVYYGIARANGLFDGQHIRSLKTKQKQMQKYTKSKIKNNEIPTIDIL